MKIESPQTIQHEGRHVFTAKIHVDNRGIKLPKELWFSLRDDQIYEYPDLSDAFLIGMLPIAMKLGEAIRVEGRVSERLAYGLQTYQSILNSWWPETFDIVVIDYEELVDRRDVQRPGGVGSCFSGGVDSFYTVLRHLPEARPLPGYQLTHALMINGFLQIFDFKGEGSSKRIFDIYRPVLDNWNLKLLMIDTNVRFFKSTVLSHPESKNCSNLLVSACAHVMSNLFGRFIIPGELGHAYIDLLPHGFHPVLDHHLETDTLQFIFHAEGEKSRASKIEYFSDNPVIHQYLRVCSDKLKFDDVSGCINNCCKCNKCIRTLITLDLLGKIKSFKTFPDRFNKFHYRNPYHIASDPEKFILNNLALAKKLKKRKWTGILEKAIYIREQSKQNN